MGAYALSTSSESSRRDEVRETLFDGALDVIQPTDGYRFSLDSLLLALFAWNGPGGRALDLGTGSGIVALLLARCPDILGVDGLELQPRLVDIARRNAHLCGVSDRVRIIEGDLRQAPSVLERRGYDQVVVNPPYYRLGDGRLNPHPERAAARHELTATLDDVLAAAVHASRDRAPIRLVYPVRRLQDAVTALERHGLVLRRLRFVHPLPGRPARQLLLEAATGGAGEVRVEEPLVVHVAARRYSDELLAFLERLRS